jgi:hypothetical protein
LEFAFANSSYRATALPRSSTHTDRIYRRGGRGTSTGVSRE